MVKTKELAGEVFYPTPEAVANAYLPDYAATVAEAANDLPGFWGRLARQFEWYRPWAQVVDDSNAPFYRWFVGGKVNIVHNALDRHMRTAVRNKAALIFEGEPGDTYVYTYQQLNREVNQFASTLRAMGIGSGDRVAIFMGRVPQQIVAMLACAKIGAVHVVVPSSSSAAMLHHCLQDSEAKLLITGDGAWNNGKMIDLKAVANVASSRVGSIQSVICVRRTGQEVSMVSGRDFWYHDLMALPAASPDAPTAFVDAEDPLFWFYAPGGKEKPIVHAHGGYMVNCATSLQWVFDLRPTDVYWCTADPASITGHSYLAYAPFLLGATSFMYEGAPGQPSPERWWQMVSKYAITVLYADDVSLAHLRQYGNSWPEKHDLSSLRLLGVNGEVVGEALWRWFYEVIGNGRCPIMDTWWQAETGSIMISPLPSTPIKPGSAGRPLPGIVAAVVDAEGNTLDTGEEGYLVIQNPWPAMFCHIEGDTDRYVRRYWGQFMDQGWYLSGDKARMDEDGYIWLVNRQSA
ncbi:MAG: AMP-binding protein [Anaerolineales bacterium]|nr:AMP-binding protein [Anaerolineales bacterium]